jgi:hypothetical protein
MPGEVAVYQAVADRGELTTRTRLMFWVMPQATVADTLAYVDALPEPGSVSVDSVRGNGGGLGIWGLKLGMDGGVEGGFLCEPYANKPRFPRARVLGAGRLRAGGGARRRPRLAGRRPCRRRLRSAASGSGAM